MGSLIRWLKVGKHLTAKQHSKVKTRMSKPKRVESRNYGASKPVLRRLFEKEKGFNVNLGEVCSEPSLSTESDGDSSGS